MCGLRVSLGPCFIFAVEITAIPLIFPKNSLIPHMTYSCIVLGRPSGKGTYIWRSDQLSKGDVRYTFIPSKYRSPTASVSVFKPWHFFSPSSSFKVSLCSPSPSPSISKLSDFSGAPRGTLLS